LASTVDYRSRSREKGRKESEPPSRAKSIEPSPDIILPIQEEESTTRGRSVTRKADTAIARRAIALLAQKQRQIQNEGQARAHLGRFAKNVQAAHRAQQAKQTARSATAPPPPKARSYDEIEKAIEEVADPLAGGVRKKIAFPDSAFLHRQRVDSAGERRLRYQGRAIRV